MGRIFISAGHGGGENAMADPGAVAGGTTEAKEMILLRDLIVAELRSRNLEVLAVPDNLNRDETIAWINARHIQSDVALEIHADAFFDPAVRGTSVYYIANNEQRKADAEQLLLALLRRVPQLVNRGAKPDSTAAVGSLGFCRRVISPSLLMEVGFLTNAEDLFLIQNRRRDIAAGIADGLAAWSRRQPIPTATPAPTPTPTYPPCNININGFIHGEQGIIVSGNAFIPVDLVDTLGIDLSKTTRLFRLSYKSVVYVRAIELRDFNISVSWDNTTKTVNLKTILQIDISQINRIMGRGNTTEMQLMMFLKANNESALKQFPDIPKLYREEGMIEGVNYDIAFCQMCFETNFLRFGGDIKPTQNNFASIGAVGGSQEAASFPSARIGVRAHIQQLKAYASTEPIVQEIVAPRFRFIRRGIAPTVEQLSGRWSADLRYGIKIMAVLRRFYELAGLL